MSAANTTLVGKARAMPPDSSPLGQTERNKRSMAINSHHQLELELLKDEYKVLKNEIVSNLESARQVMGITVASIGVLIALGKPAVDAGMVDVFLIVPFLFYALAWTQLRYVFLVLDMGVYLRIEIAPRIRNLLTLSSPESKHDYNHILSWENKGRSPRQAIKKPLFRFLFIPIAGANFGIPLLAAMFSIIAFFYFRNRAIDTTCLQKILILGNMIALLYSSIWGVVAEKKR
jgi:hypothetical protein